MDPTEGRSSIRFLSFANDGEDEEKTRKLKEAASKIEEAIAREQSLKELVDYKPTGNEELIDPANDTRSLFERLQEQRDKKQEAYDESHRLSNLVSKLDEDEVSYLNQVVKNQREEELRKRLEIQDMMEEKRRLDERKIMEEEERMKEILMGKKLHDRPGNSLGKSKLSSIMKARPKIKSQSKIKSPNK